MLEAQLQDSGSGVAPATEGWFVVNVRDAEWWFADSRGSRCAFENEYGDVPVDSGECRLLVEGEERLLRPWDFFHSPPGRSTPSWARATARA